MPNAIVMGATSGLGLEVAKILARKGFNVGVAGRRSDRLQKIVNEVDGIVAYESIDVTNVDAVDGLFHLINKLGGVDLYFHSSGIGWQNKELQQYKELDTVQTNCTGFTRMVSAMFNYFAAHGGGHLACISSIAGTMGLGAAPAYSASKAFNQHYLEALCQLASMRNLNIHISDIRPGFVATDLIAGSNYPLQLDAHDVAEIIVKALKKHKSVVTIDWRYRLLVAFWRLIPRRLWVKMKIG